MKDTAETLPDELFDFWFYNWNRAVTPGAPPAPVMEIAGDIFYYRPDQHQIWKNDSEFTPVGPGCFPEELMNWVEANIFALPGEVVPWYRLFARECLRYSARYGMFRAYMRRFGRHAVYSTAGVH